MVDLNMLCWDMDIIQHEKRNLQLGTSSIFYCTQSISLHEEVQCYYIVSDSVYMKKNKLY